MGLSTGMILALFVCSAISVIAMLRVLTNIVEHETELHDMRNRLKEIQYQQELRDAQIRGLVGVNNDEPENESEIEPKDAVKAVEQAEIAAQGVADALEDAAPAPAQAA